MSPAGVLFAGSSLREGRVLWYADVPETGHSGSDVEQPGVEESVPIPVETEACFLEQLHV